MIDPVTARNKRESQHSASQLKSSCSNDACLLRVFQQEKQLATYIQLHVTERMKQSGPRAKKTSCPTAHRSSLISFALGPSFVNFDLSSLRRLLLLQSCGAVIIVSSSSSKIDSTSPCLTLLVVPCDRTKARLNRTRSRKKTRQESTRELLRLLLILLRLCSHEALTICISSPSAPLSFAERRSSKERISLFSLAFKAGTISRRDKHHRRALDASIVR